MTRRGKLLEKMRENPFDWRIEDIEALAVSLGITIRKSGGSHFVFAHPRSRLTVTIPFRRPIKPAYIRLFLELVQDVTQEDA